jgi:hypothetical protein
MSAFKLMNSMALAFVTCGWETFEHSLCLSLGRHKMLEGKC